MSVAWFIVLALMFTGYAILDGFDLGVGALHMLLGRNQRERAILINSIGPVWNGNEVWLLAGGGSMVVAFPHLYASGFSGFYLALMLVLWLLILRGVGLEFRHQIDHPMWRDIWDFTFSVSSALLAVLFGVAVGNVLIGVPYTEPGIFQGSFSTMLNPFALLGGVLGLVILSMHGASYIAMKTEGDLQARARQTSMTLFYITIVLLLAVTAASFWARPDRIFLQNYLRFPVLFLITLFGVACVVAFYLARQRNNDRLAFLAGAGLIVSVLGSVAAGLFPRLLPARIGMSVPGYEGLTIYNTGSGPQAQAIAMGIYLVGIAIVIVYMVYVYRVWGGKVTEHGGYHA